MRPQIEYFGVQVAQGVVYGDYYLIGRLARGGMAEIFLAKSRRRGDDQTRLLALKRTLPEYSSEEDFISMFTDEARIASGLSHPHICRVVDHGRLADQHYLVMEFVHGKDLKVVAHRALQRKEPIAPPFVAYILARIAEALHAAHIKRNEGGELEKVVHRDVSPQNILISYDGVPKLIDFGIAKAKDRLAKTQAGLVKGKFAYMSPEQAIGGDVDFRTDIFALGVVLYELLVGQLPFKGSSDFSTLKRIARAEYTPPPDDAVPSRVRKIIERCFARRPEDRFASAQDLADELDRYLEEEGRSVEQSTLSSYLRKLFRDEYISETARMKEYIETEVPTVAGSSRPERLAVMHEATTTGGSAGTGAEAEIEDDTDEVTQVGTGGSTTDEIDPDESTKIQSFPDLAAGFAAIEDEAPTGLADLLEPGEDDAFAAPDPTPAAPLPTPVPAPRAQRAPLDGSHFDEPTINMPIPSFVLEEQARAAKASKEAPTPMPFGASERTTRDVGADAATVAMMQPPEVMAKSRRPTPPTKPTYAIPDADLDDGEDSEVLDLGDEATVEMSAADIGPHIDADGETGELAADDKVTTPIEEEPLDLAAKGDEPSLGEPEEPESTGDTPAAVSPAPLDDSKSERSGGRSSSRTSSGRRGRSGTRRRSRPNSQPARKQSRRSALLTHGEIATLAVVGALSFTFLVSTYYVVHNGVPAFASSLQPAIEKLTGKLPSSAPQAPSPGVEGSE